MGWNNFLMGSENDFYNFVDSIKSEDKVGLITHNDLDGIVSAILLEKILESKSIKVERINFVSCSKGMFDNPSKFCSENGITKIILTDIGADGDNSNGFQDLREKFDTFLIDHHQVFINFKDTKNILKSKAADCSTWVLYNLAKKYFGVDDFTELVCATMIIEWSFNDTENMKFLEQKYPGISKNMDESELKKLADKISSALIYYQDDVEKVYHLIKNRSFKDLEEVYQEIEEELKKSVQRYEKESEFYPEKNLYFAYFNPKFSLSSIIATKMSKKNLNSTYIIASDTKNNQIRINARNQGGNQDVSVLLRKGVVGLKNAMAGGHKKASGATIMNEDLNKFKENLLICE